MKNPQRLLLAGVVVALVVLCAFFVSRLEKRVEKVPFGPNTEARTNPRLAALRLLARFGFATRTLRDPEVLPARGAVVMLPSNVFLDPSRIERWRAWVRDGGILVMGLDLPPESRDPLLHGITVAEKYAAEPEEEEQPTVIDPGIDPEEAPAEDEIGAADSDEYWTFEPLSTDTEPDMRLALRPSWVMPKRDVDRFVSGYYVDEGGVVGIFAEGQGHLVVLADDTIFDNGRIAGVDHALFLWHLVKFFGSPPEVAVLLGDRVAFLAWLWRVAWPLLVALLLLALVFIWEKAPRFGPPIELKNPGQRGLRTHLQATSTFLWRHHEQAALLEPLRAEVLRRARLAIPGWPAFTAERCRAELSRIARLPEPAVDAAMRGVPPSEARSFVALIATLETLRKAL